MTQTLVATANVLGSLGRDDARAAVAAVVEHRPDLVALQEWHPWRWRVLRAFPEYDWFQPLVGGCALGARRERFVTVSTRTVGLSRAGRADRSGRLLGLEPPRRASVAVHRDRAGGGRVALVGYHLASQVQDAHDAYRDHDRPALVARHRREAAALARLVADLDRPAYVCGDSNFHGFRLPGLVSAWEGRSEAGGTLGPRRRVDDVHGPTAPLDVRTVPTRSDHLAVLATYA